MKIAIIGAGAMGSIYGSYLSQNNDVYMLDINSDIIDDINNSGITIEHNNILKTFHPNAKLTSKNLDKMDLIILFVKSNISKIALSNNKNIIGENTYIMSLQNGAGHEEILLDFVDKKHIIIGTTEDNGHIKKDRIIKRGGEGITNIGMIDNQVYPILKSIKNNFDLCGFNTFIHNDINKLIWNKLLINASLSVVTAILQVNLGYITNNKYALNLVKQLLRENIKISKSIGLSFNFDEELENIKNISYSSPNGYTSIYTDILNNKKTEIDYINGYILNIASQNNIEAPINEFIVNQIYALENKY